MKKSALLTLVFLLLSMSHLSSQQLKVNEAMRIQGIVTMQDMKPYETQVHPVAARAMARGEKPGTFSNVRYEFAGNVRPLTPAQKNRIKLRQDGILDLTGEAFRPSPDSVYVDPESDLVIQADPVDDNQMIAFRPSLSAVFDDIEVPEQEVPVTLANTISMAKGVVESSLQLDNKYAVNLQFDSVTFVLDKVDKDSLTATLVGQILLTNPRVEGRYSKNGGYRLVFKATEQVDMKIYTTMKLKEEVKTPIWGTEIEISDLGKCEVGLFILATLDGQMTLAVEIHQGLEMAMGARGGTFYYVPTSIKNVSTLDYWCDIGYDVTSEIKAFVGFQCTANLKVKGYNALDVYVNGGMEGTVTTDGMDLSADVGLRLKAGGKVVSKKFTLVDKYYSLWKFQKPDYQGYEMLIHEACAWGDYVAGEVHSITDSKTIAGKKDTVPYQGTLTVIVQHPGNQKNEYTAATDEYGVFIAREVPLKYGDKVMVKMSGVASPGPAVDATIPFKEISLWSADYYAGVAEGAVAGSRSKWAVLAGRQSAGSSPAAVMVQQNTQADRLKNMMAPSAMASKIEAFRNNLTVYKGPVEFVTKSAPAVTLNTPGMQGSKAPATTEKPKVNKGTVNSPVGTFTVTGLAFEPGQMVKARVVVEGFTVESGWIETEGLMVSAIEYDSLKVAVRPGVESLSARNSFVVVSSIRGETSPTGTVKMVRGADAPHGSVTGAQQVPEFPEAKKAKVWFSKTAVLTPLADNPGAAIASTGPWSATYSYSSPGDVLIPAKNRKHPFEMVTYVYKNKDLGYTSFIDQCASCTSPVNVVEKIETITKPGMPGMGAPAVQPKAPVPVQQPKVTKTPVIR